MARTYQHDDKMIGFEEKDAWFRIEQVSRDRFIVDASCEPSLSPGNLRKLREWIDARLAELEGKGD